jgi:hypothetical protein
MEIDVPLGEESFFWGQGFCRWPIFTPSMEFPTGTLVFYPSPKCIMRNTFTVYSSLVTQ